jgi:transcriptional regulator with XRE-family HTH domain
MGRITNGERIRRKRVQMAWTQADLAKRLNVSQMTVSNWETEKVSLDPEGRDKIFKLLGIGIMQQEEAEVEDSLEQSEQAPSPFGAWLNKIRIEKRISVPELSQLAVISGAAIYNIEAGRITNPRVETVKKLEKALGVDVPSETSKESRSEATVKGVGEFFEFDPHNKSDWPDGGGIYVLYDISERPIYVGQGSSIKRRIKDHEEKFWFKEPIVMTAAYILVEDETLRKNVETILIRFLKKNAVINRQNVERD